MYSPATQPDGKNKNMKRECVLLNCVDNKGWTKLSLYNWVLVHFNLNFQFIRRCKSRPDFDIHLYYSIFVKMGEFRLIDILRQN